MSRMTANHLNKFEEPRMMAWDASQRLQDAMRSSTADLPHMLETAHQMSQVLENARIAYNNAVVERDAAHRRWQTMDTVLQQVENVVRRYALVVSPIIASDGYTYELEAMSNYLKECRDSRTNAYSQQTKEELANVVVPNLSLARLVSYLKSVRLTEVPEVPKRSTISSVPVGARSLAWAMDGSAVAASMSAVAASGNINSNAPGGPTEATSVRAAARPFESMGDIRAKIRDKHPCLRVFGFCNFSRDCTFANYPYSACLNYIKGKCRFGSNCKELHVNPADPRFQNPRSHAPNHGGRNSNNANPGCGAEWADEVAKEAESEQPVVEEMDIPTSAPVAAVEKSGEAPVNGMDSTSTAESPKTIPSGWESD